MTFETPPQFRTRLGEITHKGNQDRYPQEASFLTAPVLGSACMHFHVSLNPSATFTMAKATPYRSAPQYGTQRLGAWYSEACGLVLRGSLACYSEARSLLLPPLACYCYCESLPVSCSLSFCKTASILYKLNLTQKTVFA